MQFISKMIHVSLTQCELLYLALLGDVWSPSSNPKHGMRISHVVQGNNGQGCPMHSLGTGIPWT